MPTGISQTAVNPAALSPRPATPSREPASASAASTENAQASLGPNGEQAVRAPEQSVGSQGAENNTNADAGQSEQAASAGAQPPPGLEQEVNRGVGGNVDITA
jgi:hypothetical protein